jgi:hypothetical protein
VREQQGDPAQQERHGGGHAESAGLEGRVERRPLPFLPTSDFSASFRLQQRKHLSVVEKSPRRRAGPMRTSDDLVGENTYRPDRKLVHIEAPARFGQRLDHVLLVAGSALHNKL